MDIQGAFQGVAQSFKHYCHTTQQATMSNMLKIKDLRNNPEFFQKVCQVAFAILQLIIINNPGAAVLSRFSFALATAGMHDFYRFLQQPRQWFFPVNAQVIDENLVLEDMARFIYRKLVFLSDVEIEPIIDIDGIENGRDEIDIDHEREKINEQFDGAYDVDFLSLRQLLRDCLKAQLKKMDENNDAYRSLDEFKDVVYRRLIEMKKADFNEYDFDRITHHDLKMVDLSDLNKKNQDYHVAQWIRHVPLAERILSLNWMIVDVGCVGLYLQGWKLIDTAKWAEQIGQYPAFQWVKNHHLEKWVVGLVCTAFSWKLFEAARKLYDENLTVQQKRNARWDVVTSTAELTLFTAIFLNQIGKTHFNHAYLQWLAIGAKSLGLLNIITRPEPEFFQKPEAAPAA